LGRCWFCREEDLQKIPWVDALIFWPFAPDWEGYYEFSVRNPTGIDKNSFLGELNIQLPSVPTANPDEPLKVDTKGVTAKILYEPPISAE
jgi:hypothetical protein